MTIAVPTGGHEGDAAAGYPSSGAPANVFLQAAQSRGVVQEQPVNAIARPTNGSSDAVTVQQQTTVSQTVVQQSTKITVPGSVVHTVKGDGVTETKHHRFPLPPPLREYAPEYERGKYLVPSVTGESAFDSYERATTIAKAVDETSLLEKWKVRQVLKGIKANPHLIHEVDPDDNSWSGKRKINDLAEDAMVRIGSSRNSEFGDSVHAWSAAVENGQVALSQVPDEIRPYVEVYLRELAAYGVRTVPGMIERVVYNSEAGAAGSFDRIQQLADGTMVIGDIKTSASINYSWLSISVQLAEYAYADALLSEDGSQWLPMVPVSREIALVAHIPSDAYPPVCVLKTVNLSAGKYALDLAVNLRAARNAAGKVIPGDLPKP